MGGGNSENFVEEDSWWGIALHVMSVLIITAYHGYFLYFSVDINKNPRLKLFLARGEAWLQLLTTHSDRSITAVQMLRNITGVHAALAGVAALGGVLIALKGGNSNSLFAGIGMAFYASAFACFGLCCRAIANLEYMISLFPQDCAEKWLAAEQQAELQRQLDEGASSNATPGAGHASASPAFPQSPASGAIQPAPAATAGGGGDQDNSPAMTPTQTPTAPVVSAAGGGGQERHFGAIPASVIIRPMLPKSGHLVKPFNPDSNESRCRNTLRVLLLTSNTGLRFVFVAFTVTFMIFGPLYLFLATIINSALCYFIYDNPRGGFSRDLRGGHAATNASISSGVGGAAHIA